MRAVARRDVLRVRAGRRGRSTLGIALALVLPVAAVPCGGSRSAGPTRVVVAGDPPERVRARAEVDPEAPVAVWQGTPTRVEAARVPPWLRAALDGDSPQVVVHRPAPMPRVPGRNVWVLLLAASLLTGPLVESLPGERAQKTWETLRAAPVTALEVLAGKWLAWTLASLGVAVSGVAAGLLIGTQSPNLSLLAMPLVLGSVVGLGLWLLRTVEDPAGAATIPVRVVPLVLLVALVAAAALQDSSPLLAAALPFGGPLWLVGLGSGATAGQLAVAAFGTVGAVAGLLLHGARTLDDPPRTRWPLLRPVLPVLAGGAVAVLALHTPALWASVGGAVHTPPHVAALACAAGWLVTSLVVVLRGPTHNAHPVPRLSDVPAAVVAGGALAAGWLAGGLPSMLWSGGGLAPTPGQAAPGAVSGLLFIVAGECLFRGLPRRASTAVVAGLVWCATVWPADPVAGAVAALMLGAAGWGGRWWRSALAATVWAATVCVGRAWLGP